MAANGHDKLRGDLGGIFHAAVAHKTASRTDIEELIGESDSRIHPYRDAVMTIAESLAQRRAANGRATGTLRAVAGQRAKELAQVIEDGDRLAPEERDDFDHHAATDAVVARLAERGLAPGVGQV